MMRTTFSQRLGIAHPIIQAPMAGANATPPGLVAAVGEAGALGFIGAAYMTPREIVEQSRAVRALSSRPFGINLFAPTPAPPSVDATAAVRHVARYHAELGIAPPDVPNAPNAPNAPKASDAPDAPNAFDDQLAAVLESDASALGFTFGVPTAAIEAAKARGLFVFGTATTVDEAVALERAGVDAVVAQGSEAGAHRGTFAVPFEQAMIGTMALVPQAVDAVRVPVVASGGIMDGRGIVAALALGAAAVQMGTAFLTCDECGVAESYKAALLAAHEDATRPTRAFSGRVARGIVNRFMQETEDAGAILPYPLQNALTRAMRTAAARAERPEYLSLWAGQGVRMARRQSAAALVRRLVAEANDARRRLMDV